MNQLVFVTGGTGFIGSHVVAQLLDKGYRVRAAARSAAKLQRIFPDASNLEAVEVPTLTSDYTKYLKGVDVVIHMAAELFSKGSPSDQIFEAAYDGTLHIVRQSIDAGIKKIIITGTFASLFDSQLQTAFGKELVTEKFFHPATLETLDRHQAPMTIYQQSKTLADKKVWELAKEYPDVDFTILLPPAVFGPLVPNFPVTDSPTSIGTNYNLCKILTTGTEAYPSYPLGHLADPSATVSDSVPIETAHEDMIHDAQLDYYGKRLATCSSDRTVKVFDVVDGDASKTSGGHTLKGHTGPVWQVAWAHPKFGHILASCSYDGKVLIWKEQQSQASAGGWSKVGEHTLHTASVNSVSWAPHELGAMLACASSDGKISVLTFKDDGSWVADIFNGHAIGCNAVSWAPAVIPGSLITPQQQSIPGQQSQTQSVKRFASAGCDNLVKIWGYREDSQSWVEEDTLEGHADWVRDVAWAPNIGLPKSYIATASQDKTVLIWTKDTATSPWVKTALDPSSALASPSSSSGASSKFPDVVWRLTSLYAAYY
ncbi:protein transporter SEC13 [Lentinula edodes]|uniref:Protein transporter SEC13 n=1 Tax=Lentinula edodes TaxID=5353 RepID=A0A1Q3EJ24_LENED|nr:protein transporter SEC13 [Lentinula edodes]